MEKQSQMNMNVTFMMIPLNAAEKRKIKRRVSWREPVVFVEPSSSTKQPEAKASSQQVSIMKKPNGLTSKEPVIFLDSLVSTKTPEVSITFGSPSTQTRMKEQKKPECSALKKEGKAVPSSTQKNMKNKKEPVLSAQRSAFRKEEAKGASLSLQKTMKKQRSASNKEQPAIQSRVKKGLKHKEQKTKGPEESATLPRKAQRDKQTEPKEVISCVQSILKMLTAENFQDLVKQLEDVTVDTEDRLNAIINLIFEKAMLRPESSVLYANMCRCLTKVSLMSVLIS